MGREKGESCFWGSASERSALPAASFPFPSQSDRSVRRRSRRHRRASDERRTMRTARVHAAPVCVRAATPTRCGGGYRSHRRPQSRKTLLTTLHASPFSQATTWFSFSAQNHRLFPWEACKLDFRQSRSVFVSSQLNHSCATILFLPPSLCHHFIQPVH